MNSAFLGFLGIIGALLTWFFKNNLEDAKVVAARMVREEMDGRVKALVEEEFRYWERSARPERVIGQTLVTYYLPGGDEEPKEFYLVRQRGFQQVLFCSRMDVLRQLQANVVVADFQNCQVNGQRRVQLTDRGWLTPESEAWARAQIDDIRAVISEQTVLVVYVRGIVAYLNDAKFEAAYVLPANNQVTLVGHAGSGAYVAFGTRQGGRR